MADFDTPFGSSASLRRYPNASEKTNGHDCDALDISLFNGEWYRIEYELKSIIDAGGITHTDTSHDRVLLAINALISAATGGSPSDYILMSQAEARFPIHNEILTSDGKMGVTTPSTGTVRLPGNISFLHRGIGLYTTAQEDFGTSASKTYHLRWDFATNDYLLRDLTDAGYNPTSLSETDSSFDSTYDDMLIARVVTNSSNVCTITDLTNKARLMQHSVVTGINWQFSGANFSQADFTFTLDWSRTPATRAFTIVNRSNNGISPDQDQAIFPYGQTTGTLSDFPVERYRSRFAYRYDFSTGLQLGGDFTA